MCVKFSKLIMGSGEAIPSEPPSLALTPTLGRQRRRGVGFIPLVGLSSQAA
jgi:hypothetical protein